MNHQGITGRKLLPLLFASAAILAGCSGGGATCGSDNCSSPPIGSPPSSPSPSPGSGDTPITSPTLSVTVSSRTVTSAAPVTVTATLVDASRNPVPNTVVQFDVDDAIGSLSAPSALTNDSGIATVVLSPAANSNTNAADTLTASVSITGTSYTATTGYQLSSSAAQFVSFVANDLDSNNKLAAYNQTGLTLTMSGVTASNPVTVSVTSDCVASGKAKISPATTTSTSGTITFTYQDTGGCGSSSLHSDNIIATAQGALPPTQTLVLGVEVPAARSVAFVDDGVTQIFLKGSGFQESASVRFKVVDIANNPLPNEHVTMDLSTYVGGLQIAGGQVPVTATTDTQGIVSALVNAGTVPTPVRVRAALGDSIDGAVNTQSSSLAVGTGLPTELGFSLAQNTVNVEGYDYDNVWNSYTVSASDRSGNPIHDNTTVTFWAESGQIPTTAATSNGNGLSFVTVNYGSQQSSKPTDGHVTVLAYALGEESFNDLNGNNIWDPSEPFMDMGDVTKDPLWDNIYDPARDQYVSLLGTQHGGSSTCVDGSGSNPLFALTQNSPSEPGTCDGTWTPRVYVRRAIETILSTSRPNAVWLGTGANAYTGAAQYLPADGTCTGSSISRQLGSAASSAQVMYPLAANPVWYAGKHDATPAETNSGYSGFVTLYAADDNPIRLNPMPAGTIIQVFLSGTTTELTGIGGTPVANSIFPTAFTVPFFLPVGTGSSDSYDVIFTTPGPKLQPDGKSNGTATKSTMKMIIVRDDPPASCN